MPLFSGGCGHRAGHSNYQLSNYLTIVRLPHHLLTYGPGALLLNWEQRINPSINASVHAYASAISKHPAVVECVPAYASLLVRFAVPKITAYALREYILDLTPVPLAADQALHHEVPVCYNGPDLEATATTLKLSVKQLIKLHTGKDYLVYQLGYQPGFAFLGETDPALAISRRSSPRANVPAGSVGLAGRQTGIYPSQSPGGWQLIGRSPIVLIRPGSHPTRFQAGDFVRFFAIGVKAFADLQQNPLPWPER